MKKRLKVFQTGNYPQGNFPLERVKKIFSGVTGPIQGIFSHTSKWITEGKDPVTVGEFSNFSIEGDKVFADIEFNDKGDNYYADGILKGVSAEIDFVKNKLTKIAVLPMGIKPAVAGAEFQENEEIIEGIALEFEEVKEMTLAEILAALKLLSAEEQLLVAIQVVETVNATEANITQMSTLVGKIWEKQDLALFIEKLQSQGYMVEKTSEFSKEKIAELAKPLGFTLAEFQEPVQKTAEEIRAEVRAEIEFEAKRDALIADSKTKFPPAMQGIVEFAIIKAGEERENIIEFSETEKVSRFEKISSTIFGMKKHPTQEIYHTGLEFETQDGEIDHMAKARAATEKLYGGK